jgi:hypothetical protein
MNVLEKDPEEEKRKQEEQRNIEEGQNFIMEKSIKPQYNRSFTIYLNVSIEDIQIQNYL